MIQANKRNWRKATEYFNKMDSDPNLALNTVVYSQIISIQSTHGRWMDALESYRRMLLRGIEPNALTISSVLKGLALANRWLDAMEIFDEYEIKGVELDVVSLNGVVDACRRAGAWEAGLSFVLRRMSPSSSSSSSSSLTKAASPPSLSSLLTQSANSFQQEKEKRGGVVGQQSRLKPNIVTFNTLIGACNTVEQSLRMLGSALENRLKPDIITYNTLMHICAKTGRWEKAIWVQRHMRSTNISPDVHTYNTIINAFKAAGQWRRSTAMIGYMRSVSVRGDTVSYNSVMSACSKAGQVDTTLDFFRRMGEEGLAKDAMSYSTVISALGQAQMWGKAESIFRQTYDKRNLVLYNSMMAAYAKGYQWRKATELFNTIQRESLRPDLFSYSIIINAQCLANRWDAAMKLYQKMKSIGKIQPKAVTLTPLLKILPELDKEQANEILRDAQELRISPQRLKVIYQISDRNDFSGDEGSWDGNLHDATYCVSHNGNAQ